MFDARTIEMAMSVPHDLNIKLIDVIIGEEACGYRCSDKKGEYTVIYGIHPCVYKDPSKVTVVSKEEFKCLVARCHQLRELIKTVPMLVCYEGYFTSRLSFRNMLSYRYACGFDYYNPLTKQVEWFEWDEEGLADTDFLMSQVDRVMSRDFHKRLSPTKYSNMILRQMGHRYRAEQIDLGKSVPIVVLDESNEHNHLEAILSAYDEVISLREDVLEYELLTRENKHGGYAIRTRVTGDVLEQISKQLNLLPVMRLLATEDSYELTMCISREEYEILSEYKEQNQPIRYIGLSHEEPSYILNRICHPQMSYVVGDTQRMIRNVDIRISNQYDCTFHKPALVWTEEDIIITNGAGWEVYFTPVTK